MTGDFWWGMVSGLILGVSIGALLFIIGSDE